MRMFGGVTKIPRLCIGDDTKIISQDSYVKIADRPTTAGRKNYEQAGNIIECQFNHDR